MYKFYYNFKSDERTIVMKKDTASEMYAIYYPTEYDVVIVENNAAIYLAHVKFVLDDTRKRLVITVSISAYKNLNSSQTIIGQIDIGYRDSNIVEYNDAEKHLIQFTFMSTYK